MMSSTWRNTYIISMQILLDDVRLSEQVMDLIFFLLSILAQRKKVATSSTKISIQSCVLHFKLYLLLILVTAVVLN